MPGRHGAAPTLAPPYLRRRSDERAHAGAAPAPESNAAVTDLAWIRELDWSVNSPGPREPAPLEEPSGQPMSERGAEARTAPGPDPVRQELLRWSSGDDQDAPSGGSQAVSARAQELLAAPLSDVADRLERIAGRLRRRSSAAPADLHPDADPLELLVTGFVLGYISREEMDSKHRR
jgi:hypothetical protein